MKTLIIYACNSIDKYPNYLIDYTLELDHDGLLRVIREERDIQYDNFEVAVYRNWDYYKVEENEF